MVFTPGTVVFEPGDPADSIYFVSAGLVTVLARASRDRRWIRLDTVAAGSAFGELAVMDGVVRSSRVIAEEPTLCHVLGTRVLDDLVTDHPRVAVALHRSIARSLSARLRHATREIQALGS
jgi:glutaminase